MEEVWVTGLALVSALGDTELAWARLLAGRSAIATHQPFPDLPPYPMALIGAAPADFQGLRQRAVTTLLQDAGLAPPLPECAVVLGSSRGQQGQWEALARQWHQGEPPRGDGWVQSLPHMGAISTAAQIGSLGPVHAPTAACATGLHALFQGYELIRQGRCQQAIAGAIETPLTPLTLVGFARMGALAASGCYPFDRRREGLVLGEAAALFFLESAASARQRQARRYGRILGVSFNTDAYHLSAPDPHLSSRLSAVKNCLHWAQLYPEDISFIHAHGTSTRLNDAAEAALIQTLWGDVAVSSTKGATGHSLGASGAVGAAFCLLALRDQVLPPCVGLSEPEFSLNLVRQALSTPIDAVLSLSFGFSGQNAAIALSP